MGGFDTRVTDDTRNLFLEAAHFRAFGHHRPQHANLVCTPTPAHRFERGVDPELPRIAVERDANSFSTSPAACLARWSKRCGSDLPTRATGRACVRASRARHSACAGRREVERILRALGLGVRSFDDGWERDRADASASIIAIEEDLIEEIARIHGYDACRPRCRAARRAWCLPPEAWATSAMRAAADRARLSGGDQLRLRRGRVAEASGRPDEGGVPLANPLSAELSTMRTMLLPGLVDRAASQRRAAAGSRAPVRDRQVVRGPARRRWKPAASPWPPPLRRRRGRAVGRWPRAPLDFHDIKGDLDSWPPPPARHSRLPAVRKRLLAPWPLGRRVSRRARHRLDRRTGPALQRRSISMP
jgi:phenylalanyl-tRNA synthetase beta chain